MKYFSEVASKNIIDNFEMENNTIRRATLLEANGCGDQNKIGRTNLEEESRTVRKSKGKTGQNNSEKENNTVRNKEK
jgi:hypothetical protein